MKHVQPRPLQDSLDFLWIDLTHESWITKIVPAETCVKPYMAEFSDEGVLFYHRNLHDLQWHNMQCQIN